MIAKARATFVSQIGEHEMTVLRDDGLYRHVRFARPGTSMYQFDLVTWPGYLAIGGDTDHFVFRRITDMFEFFGDGGSSGGFDHREYGINPHYWSEKLVAPKSAAAETYGPEAYRRRVLEWFEDAVDQIDVDEEDVIQATFGLRLAVHEQLLREHWWDDYDESIENEHGARNRLQQFEWTPPRRRGEYAPSPRPIRIDAWEWDLKDYDFHFCRACWAIVWGIGQYRASKAETATV